MARLRFPGRPGHKFNRISVRYFADDVKNTSDPAIAFLPQFKRGLQLFRELVGESDEDEGFDGFSADDVRLAEKKLEQHRHVETESLSSPEKVSPTPKTVLGTRLKSAKQRLDDLPASERTRGRIKMVVRKSYKDVVSEGLMSPSKTHEILKKKDVVSPYEKVKNKRPKNHTDKPIHFKLDQKHDVPGSHVKKTDKDMAKFLLEKAKQAQKLAQQKREQRLSLKVPVQRKEFVLPTQSSRSSRVIIPNKRFLEDDSIHSVVKKKSKPEIVNQDTKLTATDQTPNNKQAGLLDQPLILDGKRERKLSLKMKQKSTDVGVWEDYEDFQGSEPVSPSYKPVKPVLSPSHTGTVTSPLAASKFGSSLFSQSGTQFKKASEQQRLGMMGLGKKGSSIVQKAKLQLNRDALNKSKAALARSLKAKMKQEAKFEEQNHQENQHSYGEESLLSPGSQPSTADGTPEPEVKKRKRRKQCVVCHSKVNLVNAGTAISCVACREFFWKVKNSIGVKHFTCKKRGNCVLGPNTKTACRGCRLRKCLEGGLLKGESIPKVMKLFYKKFVVSEPVKTQSGSISVPSTQPNIPPGLTSPKQPKFDTAPPKSPPFVTSPPFRDNIKSPVDNKGKLKAAAETDKQYVQAKITTGVETLVKSESLKIEEGSKEQEGDSQVKVRTLSGEIRERKRKKQKAFKELLRAKQERAENILALPETPRTIPGQVSPSESSKTSPGKGPRIKHVCRNAAMVLGKTPARFPSVSEIRLSALPTKEKVQLWKKEEAVKAARGESDDERPLEEIIQHSSDSVCIVKKSPAQSAGKDLKKKLQQPLLKGYKRKTRCKKCAGCLAEACGKCRNCLDMPRFGGSGSLKQACVKRKCQSPRIRKGGTGAFLDLKTDNSGTDSNCGSAASSPRKQRSADNQRSSQQFSKMGSMEGSEFSQGKTTQPGVFSLPQISFSNSGGSEVRRLEFGSVSSVLDTSLDLHSHRLPTKTHSGKINSKRLKVDVQEKYAKKTDSVDGQFYPVSLQSVVLASKHWGSSLKTPENHPIKVDFKDICSLSMLWKQGLALTIAGSICVRTVCFLCGSAGKHELIYCNVCCEPFHEFCLDEDLPATDHLDDWMCPRCQFCHVCGRQNNLLRCDKCHDMYHPECLGPNYPTKPSRKKQIWICTKCVKCKSCGATTPGSASYATWTYDFSLCYECGQLMDKGNFCPICRKCYSDDDWESKMVQCSMCESWVHAKCEGLSDEMYEILSYMPEDMSFNCRKCFPIGCPEWEMTLKRELRNGVENILQTLIMSKHSQYIFKFEKKKSPLKQEEKKGIALLTGEKIESEKIDSTKTELQPDLTKNQSLSSESIHTVKKDEDSLAESSARTSLDKVPIGEAAKLLTCITIQKDQDLGKVLPEIESQNSEKTVAKSSVEQTDTECLEVSSKTGENTGSTIEGCDKASPGNLGAENVSNLSESRRDTSKTWRYSDDLISIRKNVKTDETNAGTVLKSDPSKEQQDSETVAVSSVDDNKTLDAREQNSAVQCEKDSNTAVEDKVSLTEVQSTADETVKGNESADTGIKLQCDNKLSCDIDQSETTEKITEKSNEEQNKKVVSIKERDNHVHFSEDSVRTVEPDYPRDLQEVQGRLKEGHYTSVALFSEDIMRIIQDYLDDAEETRCTRKKAVNSARSVFVKQMERIFPWYNIKTCRFWYSNKNFPRGMLPEATLPPSSDHNYAQWLEREQLPLSPQPSPFKKLIATPVKKLRPFDDEDGEIQTQLEGEDTRKCLLCLKYGDQESNAEGRLLYCGQDDWVHVNCALWSAEVYEDTDGSLQNLKEAYSRGKMLKCDFCQRSGATVGCNTRGCLSNYHFKCARDDKCVFQVDKKIFCKDHRNQIDNEVLSDDRFSVLRRVFVRSLYVRTVKKSWANGLNSADISVVIGSCTVECLGKLTDLSDRPRFLVPVNYMCTRVYWSTRDARRRCVYTCNVKEVHPESLKSPTIPVKDMRIVHDETHPEYVPLSKLNLSEMGIAVANNDSNLEKPDESNTIDLTENTEESEYLTMNATEDTVSFVGPLSSSFGGRDAKKLSETTNLSESWPGAKTSVKQNTCSVNLSVLSAETRKLLNMTNLEKYTAGETVAKQENDDIGLLKIASRLNTAAARSRQMSEERCLAPRPPSKRSSRSSSLEPQNVPSPISPAGRITSPYIDGSTARPFSPPFRMHSQSRSPSVEKIGSPVPFLPSVSASTTTARAVRSSSVEKYLTARPFSPPHRTVSKSCSPSLEKTCYSQSLLSSTTITELSDCENNAVSVSKKLEKPALSKLISSTTNTCISPISSHSRAVATGTLQSRDAICDTAVSLAGDIAFSDPKPISASSPLEHKNKSTKDESQNESDCIIMNMSQNQFTTSLLNSDPENCQFGKESSQLANRLEVNNSLELTSKEESCADSDMIGSGTDTVVIMTDSGEEISAEEAVLIAEAAIKQKSTEESQMVDSGECAVNKNMDVEAEKDSEKDAVVVINLDDEENKLAGDSENEQKQTDNTTASPFIPRLAENLNDNFISPELIASLKKGSNTTQDSPEKGCPEEKVHERKSHMSLNSDASKSDSDESDSEIIDITESIVKANSNMVKAPDLDLEVAKQKFSGEASKSEAEIELIDSDVEILDNICSDGNYEIESKRQDHSEREIVKDNEATLNNYKEKVKSFSEQNYSEIPSSVHVSYLQNGETKSPTDVVYADIKTKKQDLATMKEDTKIYEDNNSNTGSLRTFEINDHHKPVVNDMFHEDMQHMNVSIKDKENKQSTLDKMKVLERKYSVNTEDEIDGNSVALIDDLRSSAESVVQHDNTEKMLLIPLSNSESSENLHVGIIEDIDCDTDSSLQPFVTITPEKEGSSNSQDKNIFERMKEFSLTPGIASLQDDERSEAEKHEVLRGLGLERSEDVEKAKKSPKGSHSPLKTYPLRKNTMSPARYRDTDDMHISSKKVKEQSAAEGKEEHSYLPVLDPIAKKIKLESLAKSSADDRGPFRCEICKRSYRTEASLKLHREKCDFEVSTSDEDDNENQCDNLTSVGTDKKKNKDCGSNFLQSAAARSSLRKSTMAQRVALEVEKKRVQEENSPKRRGRPSISNCSKQFVLERSVENLQPTRHSSRRSLSNIDPSKLYSPPPKLIPRGRGRPRRLENTNHTPYLQKQKSGDRGKNQSPEKCKPGRPRKYSAEENNQRNLKSSIKQLKSREKLFSQKVQSPLLIRTRSILRQKLLKKQEDKKQANLKNTKDRISISDKDDHIHLNESLEQSVGKEITQSASPGPRRGRPRKQISPGLEDMPVLEKSSLEESVSCCDEGTSPNTEKGNLGNNEKSKKICRKYGTRRSSKFSSDKFDEMPVLERHSPTDRQENLQSNLDEEALIKKAESDGMNLVTENTNVSSPVVKRGRGRPKKHISPNVENTCESEHEFKDSETVCSNSSKKRDLPSLKQEVENFRRIKRLKRENSQDKAAHDVIEINSSDDDLEGQSSNQSMKTDNLHKSDVSYKQTALKIKECSGDENEIIQTQNSSNSANEKEIAEVLTDNSNKNPKETIPKSSNDTCKAISTCHERIETDSVVKDTEIMLNDNGESNSERNKETENICQQDCDSNMKPILYPNLDHAKGDMKYVQSSSSGIESDKVTTINGAQNDGHNIEEKNMSKSGLQWDDSLRLSPVYTGDPDKTNKNLSGIEREKTSNTTLKHTAYLPSNQSVLSASKSGQLKGGSDTEASNSSSASANSSLSNTVLKLLKEGHKVLIKNPKLGKSFLWEKTEKGYVGRPYEKDVKIQSSGSIPSFTIGTVSNSNSEQNRVSHLSGKGSAVSETVTSLQPSPAITHEKQIPDLGKIERKSHTAESESLTKLKPYCGPSSATVSSLQELEKINSRIPLAVEDKSMGKSPSAVLSVLSALLKKKGQQTSTVTSSVSDSHTDCQPKAPDGQKLLPGGISRVTTSASAETPSTRPSVEYLGGLILSSTGSISLITQSPAQVTGPARLPLSVVSPVSVLLPPTSHPQTMQPSLPRLPVVNVLPSSYSPQVHVVSNSSSLPQSVNLMSNQLPLHQQAPSLNRFPVSNPMNIQVSYLGQQSTVRPMTVQQIPYGNQQSQVILPLRHTSGIASATVTPNLQNSQPVIQPFLRNILPQQLPSSVSSVSFPSVSHTSTVSSLPNTSNDQTLKFSAKTGSAIAKDVADVVKNFKKHTPVPLSQQLHTSPGGSQFMFSDALRATAQLSQANEDKSEKHSEHNFTSLMGQQQPSSNFVDKVKHVLAKKILTHKPALHHQPVHKPAISFKEVRPGVVEGHFKRDHMVLGKKLARLDKLGQSVAKTKRHYRRRVGHMSPLKRKEKLGPGRKMSALKKRKIEGPHSLAGSTSHPILHAQKAVSSLPAAAMEEEVVETPLDAMYDQLDARQPGTSKAKENKGHLQFEITSDDGFTCKSDTIDGAWRQVIERVQDARAANRLKQLSYGGLNGLSLSGLSHSNTVYLVEQLYGAGYCQTYKFRYHSHELRRLEEPPENPSGCIRTEPFDGRKPYDMFSFLMSRYRLRPETATSTEDTEMILKSSRRATSMDLPMAMRFRKLKEHSREAVGVYRSRIHGRGLFCKRSIDAGEMIIEYAGEVIRSSLTDIREKYYESKGIGCYMFRIDDTDVVDATMKGSAARFINHSCEPNCFSKVINVDNRKHIVIFAIRQIQRGEELTYDYKFPIEDVKILCTCGSRRCRKYLN